MLYQDVTYSKVSYDQSKTTLGIVWDDIDRKDAVKMLALQSFQQGGRQTMTRSSTPRCSVVGTTNLEAFDGKTKTRMVIVPFEAQPAVCSGKVRRKNEKRLSEALKSCAGCLGIIVKMASFIEGETFDDHIYERFYEHAQKLRHARVAMSHSICLTMTNHLLNVAEMSEELDRVLDYFNHMILPIWTSEDDTEAPHAAMSKDSYDEIDPFNKAVEIAGDAGTNAYKVLSCINPHVRPKSCTCGESFGFHIAKTRSFLAENGYNIDEVKLRASARKVGHNGLIHFGTEHHPRSDKVLSKGNPDWTVRLNGFHIPVKSILKTNRDKFKRALSLAQAHGSTVKHGAGTSEGNDKKASDTSVLTVDDSDDEMNKEVAHTDVHAQEGHSSTDEVENMEVAVKDDSPEQDTGYLENYTTDDEVQSMEGASMKEKADEVETTIEDESAEQDTMRVDNYVTDLEAQSNEGQSVKEKADKKESSVEDERAKKTSKMTSNVADLEAQSNEWTLMKKLLMTFSSDFAMWSINVTCFKF